MIRWSIAVVVVLLIGVCTGLYHVKYKVRELEVRVTSLGQQLNKNHAMIKVLRAEWTYLNRPSRLEELNSRFLGLTPVDSVQVIASAGDLMKRLGYRNAQPDRISGGFGSTGRQQTLVSRLGQKYGAGFNQEARRQ